MKRVIVITGATSGIGFAAAKEFIKRGAAVIGTGRSRESCGKAAEKNRDITYIAADLSSQKQVRDAAAKISLLADSRYRGKIDVLVNNAGTFSGWYQATEDGYELQFAVNHLAPFLLTNLLLPELRASGKGKIITISSGSHYHTKINWKDPMNRKRYNCLKAYKQSKLANVLFSYELNRRFSEQFNIRAYAVDPGLVNTGIGEKRTGGLVKWFWGIRRKHGISPEKAAETIIYLAQRDLEDNTFEHLIDAPVEKNWIYWKECRPKEPGRYSKDGAAALRLWELSERLCGMAEQRETAAFKDPETENPDLSGTRSVIKIDSEAAV
ncbi:MAG: SDR family NAD(P)-dependent oxidoreductase [Spirochaetes bacterium]|nr:SDR family NAD(P)-dependent oxidoreductase [Spirochaetota bacterium]